MNSDAEALISSRNEAGADRVCARHLRLRTIVTSFVVLGLVGFACLSVSGCSADVETRIETSAAHEMINRLNKEWNEDGLFVRQFSSSANASAPWINKEGDGKKIASAAFASALFPYIYSTSNGGMIFKRSFILNKTKSPVNCACACDCGSMDSRRGPTGCANVTTLHGFDADDNKCNQDLTLDQDSGIATAYASVEAMLAHFVAPKPNGRCVWKPSKAEYDAVFNTDCGSVLEPCVPTGATPYNHFSCQYNEIVLDSVAVAAAMPGLIEAFFLPTNCYRGPVAQKITVVDGPTSFELPTTVAGIVDVQTKFINMYDLQPDEAPPVVAFDCIKLAQKKPHFVPLDISGV